MKSIIAIIISSMLTTSTVSASSPSCIDCATSRNVSSATLAVMNDLQMQSEEETASNSDLTEAVLQKLKERKAQTLSTLDRLQRETEEISIARPIFFIAGAIEKKFTKHSYKSCPQVKSAQCCK